MSKAPVLLSLTLGQTLPEFTSSQEPSERRMHWLKVPYSDILALYQAGPLRVQRNHLRRVRGADHLKMPLPLHANFLAVRLPDGSVQLADGYTRVAASELQLRPAPQDVWLGIVDVDTLKEAEHIYLAVDSRRAVKTGRDAFEEGLRKTGLLGKLVSPVFITASAVSALHAASAERDPLAGVTKFKKAIERLDPLGLPAGASGLPAGALGACLLLAQHEAELDAVRQFTAALAHPEELSAADKKLVPAALKLQPWLQERREAGALSGKNVPVILSQTLGAFLWQKQGGTGRIQPVTRDAYLAQA